MDSFKSYRKQIEEVKGSNEGILYKDCSYEDALKAVKKYIQEKKLKNDDIGFGDENTKEYLKRKMAKYREYIREAYLQLKLRVDDYEMKEFLNDALSDICGYSVLDEAFADPEITDIFVNTESEIFVEKNGKTIPYWKKFRSEEHYLDIVERFMQDAGKELNQGAKKIVNFELFQDRGCAISSVISTKQVSLTFRKHGYINVERKDLLAKEVMTEDMADLIGLMLKGELNVIYAGLTVINTAYVEKSA